MDLSLASTWLAFIGSALGAAAFVWNVVKWAVNKRRRGNQNAIELTNLDKMIEDEKRRLGDAINARRTEYHEYRRRQSTEMANRGVARSGMVKKKIVDNEDRMKHDIAIIQRESDAKIRQFEVEKGRIQNRPVE